MAGLLFKNYNIVAALKRFWPALIFAVIGTVSIISMIHFEHGLDRTEFKLFLSSWAGMLAFINFQIISERYDFSLIKQIALALFFLIGTIGIFFFLPQHDDLYCEPVIYRYLAIILVLHLLVSIVAYIKNGSIAAFWKYNRKLLVLKFESLFNSAALFLGITLALLALKFLFDADIDNKIFAQTFIAILGIFNTSYFLSRFPTDYDDEVLAAPSKGFAIFTQYILIPLNLIYILILYAYGAKILIEQSLPKGWVSNLVLWFSVLGVLAYLLNYFNPRFGKSKLAAFFKKYFFYILLAPLVLLFVAIYTRLSEYGVTENRYIVAGLGVWLLAVSIYFIISKEDNIKFIPLSLIVFVLLASFGPWDMVNSSYRSQKKRVLSMLEDHGRFDGKALIVPIDTLSSKENYKLISQLNYLERKDQLVFFNDYHPFSQEGSQLKSNKAQHKLDTGWRQDYTNSKIIAEQLKMDYRSISSRRPINEKNINLRSNWDVNTINIQGYQEAIYFHAYKSNPQHDPPRPIRVSDDKYLLLVTIEEHEFEIAVSEFISPHIQEEMVNKALPPDVLSHEFTSGEFEGKIYFNSLHAVKNDEKLELGSANGLLLYRRINDG